MLHLGILKKAREDSTMTTDSKKPAAEKLRTTEVRHVHVLRTKVVNLSQLVIGHENSVDVKTEHLKYFLQQSNVNQLFAHLLLFRHRLWSLTGGQHLGDWSLTWSIVSKWCSMMSVPRIYSKRRPYILLDRPLSP